MTGPLERGQPVRVEGRRGTFTVHRQAEDRGGPYVEVVDPRNGGLRCVPADHVRPVRRGGSRR